MIAGYQSPAASATVEPASLTGATISLVVPHIPGFVRRAVPQLGVFKPMPKDRATTIANTGRPRSNTTEQLGPADGITPPPTYAETLTPFFTRRFQRKADGPAVTSAAIEDHAQAMPEREQETIQWKYANQGVSLLQLATQESTGGPSNPFTRQLYIHAMTYLLRALPFNLSDEESTSLTAALPPSLIPEPQAPYSDYPMHSTYEDFPDYTDHFDPDYARHASRPSLLYRITARLTLQLFLTIRLLLPWLQAGATSLYHLNRRHHITERLFNTTLSTADLARRAVWGLSTTLLSFQDGRVAKLLETLLSWTLQSLSGGLYDGVGEGMAVLGLRQHQTPNPHPRHQQQSHYNPHPRSGYHSRAHSRNLSQHSVGVSAAHEYHHVYQAPHVQAQVRVRAGSMRAAAVGGPTERTLRKARSHEVMRGGAAAQGVCYSPAGKTGMRMRPGLRRVDEGFA